MIDRFNITIKVGKDFSVSFDAAEIPNNDGRVAYARITALGGINAESGVVVINDNANKLAVEYDGIKITSGIFFKEEKEGNFHYKCATDLFMFDLYISKVE